MKNRKLHELDEVHQEHDNHMEKNEKACRKFIELSRKVLNINPDTLYGVLKQYNMSTGFIKSIANEVNFPIENEVDIKMKIPAYSIVSDALNELYSRMEVRSTGLSPNIRERINPLEDSKILPLRCQNDINLSILPNFKSTELLFRLGDSKMTAKRFRDAIYYQGPTLILIQANRGHIFGGYSPKQWTEGIDGNNWLSSDESFIFTITDNKGREPLKLKVKKERKDTALFHSKITFGFGSGHDLGINLIDLRRSESIIFGYEMPKN